MKNTLLVSLNKIPDRTNPFLFLISLFLLMGSCQIKTEPYKIIRFSGNAMVVNYSRNSFTTLYVSDSLHEGALLMQRGDVLGNEEFAYMIPDSAGENMSLKYDKGKFFIDGKLVAVNITNDQPEIQLKELLDMDISRLSMIYYLPLLTESCIPYLKEISARKKYISLGIENEDCTLDTLLHYFKPRLLILPEWSDKALAVIKEKCSPEIIFIGYGDTPVKSPLPSIPSLRQLIFLPPEGKLPDNFYSLNPQIESLTLFGAGPFDFNLISSLTNLKNLVLSENDSIVNQGKIINNPKLEVLTVSPQLVRDNPALDELKNLRWAQFSYDIDQQQFDNFIAKHPGLEVVEMMDCKDLNITQSLSSLKNLQGLILMNQPLDSLSVKILTNLKYLSLHADDLKDPGYYAELKQALPNTVLAANEGACMGSGWILLLLPMIIAFRYLLPFLTDPHKVKL